MVHGYNFETYIYTTLPPPYLFLLYFWYLCLGLFLPFFPLFLFLLFFHVLLCRERRVLLRNLGTKMENL